MKEHLVEDADEVMRGLDVEIWENPCFSPNPEEHIEYIINKVGFSNYAVQLNEDSSWRLVAEVDENVRKWREVVWLYQ